MLRNGLDKCSKSLQGVNVPLAPFSGGKNGEGSQRHFSRGFFNGFHETRSKSPVKHSTLKTDVSLHTLYLSGKQPSPPQSPRLQPKLTYASFRECSSPTILSYACNYMPIFYTGISQVSETRYERKHVEGPEGQCGAEAILLLD